MFRSFVIGASILLLIGCISSPKPETASTHEVAEVQESWLAFVNRVDTLDAADLELERYVAVTRVSDYPDDSESQRRLSYLLSRPRSLASQASREDILLAEIDATRKLEAIRDLILQEQPLMTALQHKQRQVIGLEEEVDTLETAVDDLQTQVGSLQAQLEALKTIEAEMTENQKELEELQE